MFRYTVVYKDKQTFEDEVFDGMTGVEEDEDWYVIYQGTKATRIPMMMIRKIVQEEVEEDEAEAASVPTPQPKGFAVWNPGIIAYGRTLLRLEADGRDGVKLIVVDEDGVRRVRGDILTIRASGKMYRIYCVNPAFGFKLNGTDETVVIQ